jgi:cob(I)alamin adenosyltransferase
MKGKSTAAFGMALRGWNQGWSIGVFHFARAVGVRAGEENALRALGRLHEQTGEGGPVTWHTMGLGWSWTSREDLADHELAAAEGWEQVKRDLGAQRHDLYILDEFTAPMRWGWVDTDDVVATLGDRPGTQHVIITGRKADPRLIGAADLVVEMHKVKHPSDSGSTGQGGIEW